MREKNVFLYGWGDWTVVMRGKGGEKGGVWVYTRNIDNVHYALPPHPTLSSPVRVCVRRGEALEG